MGSKCVIVAALYARKAKMLLFFCYFVYGLYKNAPIACKGLILLASFISWKLEYLMHSVASTLTTLSPEKHRFNDATES